MPSEPLLPDRTLSSPSFVRDMRMFLALPARALSGISEILDSAEGFVGETQAQTLRERFELGIDVAPRALRFAEYIYNRASAFGMEVEDAVAQLAAAASNLEKPVSLLDGGRKDAIRTILSFKRDYEIARAKNVVATSEAPHFVSVSGSWGVKPVRIGNGEVVKAPILAMSVTWHDGAENTHEAFFQMSEDDWLTFADSMTSIGESRKDVEDIVV